MTVIVGVKFDNDVVLISDSRATVTYDGETFPSDNLQKIIGLNDTHIATYATNDIRAIELVLTEFQHFLSENPDATLEVRLQTFTDFSLAAFSQYNQPFVILLSTKEESNWHLYQFEYPTFISEEITTLTIKGSGSYISRELERYYNNDISPITSLKGKAGSLFRSMMSSLNRPQSSSVGGLPQVLMMTNTGVQTVHTVYIEFSPEREPDSKQIIYENGHWVQKNGSNHTDLVIIPPKELCNVKLSELLR